MPKGGGRGFSTLPLGLSLLFAGWTLLSGLVMALSPDAQNYSAVLLPRPDGYRYEAVSRVLRPCSARQYLCIDWRTCSLSSSWGELFKQLCRVNLKDSLGTIVIFRCAPSLLGVPKYRHLGRESYFFLFFCEESCPVKGSSSEDPSSVDSGVPKITAIA